MYRFDQWFRRWVAKSSRRWRASQDISSHDAMLILLGAALVLLAFAMFAERAGVLRLVY